MQQVLNKKQKINSIYEVQFFIGGNSHYQKYRVKSNDGKAYLLKLYNSSKLTGFDFSNANLLEVEILASVNSPSITQLVNNGELIIDNQKFHYIIFSFISGETILDKLKREGAFSPYAAVPIILELLNSLKVLQTHSKIVIHNNINISTVSLDYSDNREIPILTDFNQARYISSKSNSVDLNQLNPFYIAPELYNGIFTPQSDIFSVGALLYHMIMGIPPWYIEIPSFQHTQVKSITTIHAKRETELSFGLKELDELDDEHLKETIRRALSINIDNRFRNSDEFIKALKRETVLDAPKSKNQPVKKAKPKSGQGFSAIAGMQELKDKLYNDVIDLLDDKEGAELFEISIPNGMLLYGPPRCGKTFFAERFAEEAGFNYKFIKSSDLASIYIHGSQEKIGELFKYAESNAPMIICFDEIDALTPSRDKLNNASQSGEVNEFLTQLNNCGEKGIFVIGTTNYPQGIDPAVLGSGRMDIKIFVPIPDYESRKSLIKLYLKNKPLDFDIDYSVLATQTENLVTGDIVLLINDTARQLRKSRGKITQKTLEENIKKLVPSVSMREIEKYNEIRKHFENRKSSDTPERRPVGFRRPNKD